MKPIKPNLVSLAIAALFAGIANADMRSEFSAHCSVVVAYAGGPIVVEVKLKYTGHEKVTVDLYADGNTTAVVRVPDSWKIRDGITFGSRSKPGQKVIEPHSSWTEYLCVHHKYVILDSGKTKIAIAHPSGDAIVQRATTPFELTINETTDKAVAAVSSHIVRQLTSGRLDKQAYLALLHQYTQCFDDRYLPFLLQFAKHPLATEITARDLYYLSYEQERNTKAKKHASFQIIEALLSMPVPQITIALLGSFCSFEFGQEFHAHSGKVLLASRNIWLRCYYIHAFLRFVDADTQKLLLDDIQQYFRLPKDDIKLHLSRLDSPRFAVREVAMATLIAYGERVIPYLQDKTDLPRSAELDSRLKAVISSIATSPETEFERRVLRVLADAKTPFCSSLFEILRRQHSDLWVTQFAHSLLKK